MTRLLRCSLFILLAGCVAAVDPAEAPEGLDIPLIDAGSPEEAGVLALLNDPATTLALLDDDIGLDARAARGLFDGRPFTSIEDVDAVPYVGRVALDKLLAWARDGGFVPEPMGRDAATLALVNDPATTFTLLDDDVGLDRRAAQNIIDGRPFATIDALDAVSYVGTSALQKLGDYAVANGYGDGGGGGPVPTDRPCVIISEYVEGQGNNNKALEIYNCGASPVALENVGVCLVRNLDTTCSNESGAGAGMLAPGAVWTMCRTTEGTFNDPYDALRTACDQPIGGAALFTGNDRLIVFHDVDANGRMDGEDTTLDTFGDPATQPVDNPWSETNLRRCDLSPVSADPTLKFTRHPRTDLEHLGVAPPTDCAISTLARRGEDCLGDDSCEAGLRCYGIPPDGSGPHGKCVRPSTGGGGGSTCDRHTPCGPSHICAGWTLWGSGNCTPDWMAGRWGDQFEAPIPASGTLNQSVVAYGLASVPVDIEVQVHIDHPRMTDLRVTLHDPNGDSAVLWDRTTELTEWSRSFVTTGISRDDQVNGRWTLEVEDLGTGASGTLRSFHLFIVSRWD